ncbi:MAG: leucine-rich repeat domain-containing protein [Ruminococcaceae bacterium]|nr:leucine-rich repeat domain-containing protein [Oscillospiraceae bacterium]
MKKILAFVLCAVMVLLSFASCTSKKQEEKTTQTTNTGVPSLYVAEEFTPPEDEKDFVVEDMFGTEVPSLKLKEYVGEAENLVIPEMLTSPSTGEKCIVAEIGDAAFLGNETLVSVEIPKNVTVIGKGAFQSCKNLTTVAIYNGETIVDEEGNETVIPANLTKIGDSAFHNSGLSEITIPDTVTEIGFHAFSDMFDATPWYYSLEGEKVIVGDGILLKCTYESPVIIQEVVIEPAATVEPEEAEEPAEETEEAETEETAESEETEAEAEPEAPKPTVKQEVILNYQEFDLTDVKHIAYYAFNNPGAVALKVSENLLSVDRHAVFVPNGEKNYTKFLVPYVEGGSTTQATLDAALLDYDLLNAPANPFKWTFDTAESVETWNGGSGANVSYGNDGSLYARSTSKDPIIATTDRLNIPAEVFNKLVIRMKHNISVEKTDSNKSDFHIQVFFTSTGVGYSEGASYKVEDLEQTTNGEYVEYTIDLTSNANWNGVINSFRVDVGSCENSDFWIDSIEFVPADEKFDFGTLLKPVRPALPSFENPYKYKFAEKSLADAWTTSGMEYSYDSENETIHGVAAEGADPTIVSPELAVPGFEHRQLIVRMKHNFAPVAEEAAEGEAVANEEPVEEAKTYTMKVYFDNGEGYTDERVKEVEFAETSEGEKVEYTFDMFELDGWYGTVKGIKIVLLGGMNGEFDIDKIEFVPEPKLTKGEFLTKLYEADGSKVVTGQSVFADVVLYDSYYNAVLWAVNNGFIEAVETNEDNEFIYNPEILVTAQEAVDLFNAFADYKKSTVEKLAAPSDPAVVVYEMDADDRIAAIIEKAPVEETYSPLEYDPYVNTATPEPEKSNNEEVAEESKGLPVGAIIGIAGGALVVVAAIVVLIIFLLKKKKGAKK